jgi:hypothetical protein
MNNVALRTQLINEIAVMPQDKLTMLNQLIQQFKATWRPVPTSPNTIMRFAGTWQEMSDNELTEFLTEIQARRQIVDWGS